MGNISWQLQFFMQISAHYKNSTLLCYLDIEKDTSNLEKWRKTFLNVINPNIYLDQISPANDSRFSILSLFKMD